MPISEPAAVFSIRDDRDMEIKQAVLQVYRALEEKGYNPINQLVGYILSEDPTYITNYNNARSLICRLDRDELLQELLNSHQNSLDLLTDLISGDMPGGVNFALDFAALSNVSVADGVWNKSGQYGSA